MAKRITLKEFQRRFHKLRNRGFVKSLRRGPTGIGYTLVSELGLTENSFELGDYGPVTVVPARVTSREMIPFVRLRPIARETLLEVARRTHDVERRGVLSDLNSVVEHAPNSDGFFLQIGGQRIELCSTLGSVVGAWSFNEIALAQKRKAARVLYILAMVEKRVNYEAFFFLRAQLLSRVSKFGLALATKSGDTSLLLHQQASKNSVSRILTPHLHIRENEYWRFFERVQDT